MIVCSVSKVKKMYGGTTIFEDITTEIKEKDRVGLVGRNGSGKTTLFRLLAGRETPDSGQIHWKKELKIGYLEQIPDYQSKLTAKEVVMTAFSELMEIEADMKNIEGEMSRETNPDRLQKVMEVYGDIQDRFRLNGGYEIEANIEKIANGLNIKELLAKQFSSLSGGEKTKVGLCLTLLKKPNLILLDEPTNHLDLMAVEWLGNFLRDYAGTVVVISHDRYFLDEVVNKILDLEDGNLDSYPTNFSGFVKAKEERLLQEFHAYEEQQKKIKKMKEAIKRLRDWANRANPPNEGLHKRARNMERALERMEKLNRPILNRKKMSLDMDSSDRSGNDVMILRGVTKRFGERELFRHVNMHVTYQERVAIIGENGTGKSTLIKLMLNQISADEGKVKVGSNVKIGYLSQQIFSETEDVSIIEAFRNEVKVAEGDARKILARFLFYGHAVFRKLSQLSGGERMRLRLAQLMYQEINLLILDEPTNHLDIESREVLEDTLDDYEGTIVAVSHDRYFLNKLFGKIYWIENKEVHGFAGNYTYAKGKMAEKKLYKEDGPLNKLDSNAFKERRDESASGNRETNKRNLWHENLQQTIAKLEQRIEEIDLLLADITDLVQLQELFKEKEALEKQWEDYCEQLG
ncbi:ribosomal protection-like ABC-F family protein [Oceanobacillus massiliensis]|uniref:ribosomal protection-like ABC-F family protein n=1 Tax=Oceanobacillus massiliensis TaxID=1465765 RepID=UPI0002880604|nr:ABC-F type ribosomal protection protein [Oceanobacillus massiliensis]